jgi:adenylate cyclase
MYTRGHFPLSDRHLDISAFVAELKQRKVIRFSLVYMVVAWVTIQAAATVFPALSIPSWAVSLVVALTILGFPIGLLLAWSFDITPQGVRRAGARAPRAKARAAAAGVAEKPKSIAVLPFVNMSGDDENEYFSDGMTEEILNALVKMRGLQVASRTSSFAFKGKEVDVREVGDRLNAATVLEGSVRKSGTRLRITAQLIDVESGFHLWSETYDRELADVFAIQDEIARSIVDALKLQLAGDAETPLVTAATDNVEAYTKYLKGRFFFNKLGEMDLRRSLEHYQAALAVDANYAHAYAGIADSWMNLADDWVSPHEAYPKARQAASRAIELNPALAEAHTALGKVLGWYDWDFNAAELALRRAVAANPKYADAHWGLGSVLPANGRMQEALSSMQDALALDPLSALFSGWVARMLVYCRRYDEAIEQCRHAGELDVHYPRVYLWMGHAFMGKQQYEQALDAYQKSTHGIGFHSSFVVQPLVKLGRTTEAVEALHVLERDAERLYIRPESLAAGFAAIGEMDKAFTYLDRAVEARSAGMIYLNVDPVYDALRADARFPAALARVGVR